MKRLLKKLAVIAMAACMMASVVPSYAMEGRITEIPEEKDFYEYMSDIRTSNEIIDIEFDELNQDEGGSITYINDERELQDGGRPIKGTYRKVFRIEKTDKWFNTYFYNRGKDEITMIVYEDFDYPYSRGYQEILKTKISPNNGKHLKIFADPSSKYMVELSNSSGEKIIGTFRVRSYGKI